MTTATTNGTTLPKKGEAIAAILEALKLLVEPGQVVELRAIGVKRSKERPHIDAGFFDADHLGQMAAAAYDLTFCAKGVYFTLNPLNPDLLARRCNRVAYAGEGELAKDKDVIARRWLLIDADPLRDPLISATEEEKAAAYQTVLGVRNFLSSLGWPLPILADSGNGYHLLYRVDLSASDNGAVERILKNLAQQFDSERVKIDTSVFNPSRICKLPGTMARKGDSTRERPHRWSKILEVPGL